MEPALCFMPVVQHDGNFSDAIGGCMSTRRFYLYYRVHRVLKVRKNTKKIRNKLGSLLAVSCWPLIAPVIATISIDFLFCALHFTFLLLVASDLLPSSPPAFFR
jgi:hypothetical protein